jgi:hypothetical protein
VANHLTLRGRVGVSVFETTIRVLGGLLSAFYHRWVGGCGEVVLERVRMDVWDGACL